MLFFQIAIFKGFSLRLKPTIFAPVFKIKIIDEQQAEPISQRTGRRVIPR